MTDAYVRKDPGDIIRSGDWNELQIRAREEIRGHKHTGNDDGTLIPRAGIEANAIDGSRIDPTADVTVKTLTTAGNLTVKGDLTVNGKQLLGDIADLLSAVKSLQSDKLNRAGDTVTGTLNIQKLNVLGALQVNGGLYSAQNFRIIQTDAADWLRINPDSKYPGIALYKSVAIGEGGVAIGEWSQPPKGNLKVTGLITASSSSTPPVKDANGVPALTSGIRFLDNPGGGGADAAWIQYYARSGEACTLEIGVSNDGDDHIALMPSGCVGVNTTSPAYTLDVNGSVRLGGFTDADADEWPKVVWYRDPAKGWDEGLIKHSSQKGFFKRSGFGIHIEQSRDWGVWSSGWTPLLGVEGGTGNTKIKGKLELGNSDLYFTEINHNHTGYGNTTGYAAIENAANFGALMILGRNVGSPSACNRVVKLWDYLQVNGNLDVTGSLGVTGKTIIGNLMVGSWPANQAYAFLGTNALDQSAAGNYALLQGASGGDLGVTFLNSPKQINFRIGNVDQMLLANDGTVSMPAGLRVDGSRSTHIETDGSFYRYAGQAYITIDDNLYIRQANGNIRMHFDVSSGTLKTDILRLGDKWRLSAIGDGQANDDWLRLVSATGSAYYGGLAAGRLWTAVGALSGSDERLKQGIKTLDNALKKVISLRGVSFKWKNAQTSPSSQIGLIAQEVETLFPELVENGPDGMKGVNYSGFVAVLIEALKEQQVQIDKLSAAVATMTISPT